MREPMITLLPCAEAGCTLGATHLADDGRGATYQLCYHHAVDCKVRWIEEYREYLKSAPLRRST